MNETLRRAHGSQERVDIMVQFEVHPSPKNGRKIIVAEEQDSDDENEDFIPGPEARHGSRSRNNGDLDLSNSMDVSDNYRRGSGVLASKKDLQLPPDEFADGCKLLQQAALGNQAEMEILLQKRPYHVNFRDYDRRYVRHNI